jgi:rubredoxin
MTRQFQTIRIPFPGGIISPGYLQTILGIAARAKVEHARFGQRQQLLLDVPVKHLEQFNTDCIAQQVKREGLPDLVSSYPCANIFPTGSWLSEGIYKDVFDMFDDGLQLKINICDSQQTFTPFFTGHLNWISAPQTHYWRLYIRYPGTDELYAWPSLIYTNHIGQVSRMLAQDLQLKNADLPGIPVEKPLELPPFHLPYYEGFNQYSGGYWLGIYRRDETFSISFLQQVCAICLETKTGQFYATPWKSLIIPNISKEHRRLWDYALGKHAINVRHAANELNWQVEDDNEDGLVLKRHIIRYFDSADVRTYGLSFSIRVNQIHAGFGGIVISRQELRHNSRLKGMQRYTISYTPGFNPNSGVLLPYRTDVAKEHLGPYVTALCRQFYEENSLIDPLQQLNSRPQAVLVTLPTVYQCAHCLTVYDESTGDPLQNILPGTPFSALPEHYCCSLCESPLTDFAIISAEMDNKPKTGQD